MVPMGRVACSLGILALAAAIGAMAVGELIVVPGLRGASDLVGPNLARSMTAPLHLRCAEIVFGAAIVLALAVPRWLGSRVATTVALLVIGCAAVERFVILPELYEAWSRVDLVAMRPVERVADAQALADRARWLDYAHAALLALLVGFAGWRHGASQRGTRAGTNDAPDRPSHETTSAPVPATMATPSALTMATATANGG